MADYSAHYVRLVSSLAPLARFEPPSLISEALAKEIPGFADRCLATRPTDHLVLRACHLPPAGGQPTVAVAKLMNFFFLSIFAEAAAGDPFSVRCADITIRLQLALRH